MLWLLLTWVLRTRHHCSVQPIDFAVNWIERFVRENTSPSAVARYPWFAKQAEIIFSALCRYGQAALEAMLSPAGDEWLQRFIAIAS